MSNVEVPRDRYGRPLIIPPGGGKPVPYKRASSFGKALDDMSGLMLWKQRLTVQGIARDPSLQLKATLAGEDKRALNAVVDEAFKAAGGERKADIGTSLHALTEQYDRGIPIHSVPAAYEADLEAYARVTRDFEWLEIEQFVVNDLLKAAGTPDRIANFQGDTYVVDLKTGSIDFPHGYAVQLAIYAHSLGYDPATGQRRELPQVNRSWGILIHLPAGSGECSLHAIDLNGGIKAAALAVQVDQWRKRKNLTQPLEIEGSAA